MKQKKKKQGKEKPSVTHVRPKAEMSQKQSSWPWAVPLLLLAVIVAYWNSVHGMFQFDDFRLIRFNFSLRDMSNWRDIFLSERYRPLLAWTFALNYRLSGQDPFSYHLFNIGFHALAVVLFYSFLKRQSSARWVPLAAAALMAVHPLNTESVSYVASRSTVLCAVFYFSALLCFDSYLRSSRKKFAAGYLLFFLLGATVKEEAATIPIVAFLYHWLFFQGQNAKESPRMEKRGIHVLAGSLLVAGSVFRIWMQLQHQSVLPYTIDTWIPSQITVWLRYLGKACLPIGLNIDPDVPAVTLASPLFWISLVIIVLLCGLAWRIRRTIPFIAFWILWYFLNLLPSSVFPLNDLMAEHRSYISTFGFAACIAFVGIAYRAKLKEAFSPRVIAVAVITILLLIGTVQRNKVWATEITLWSDSAQKSPQKVRPRLNLASGYMKEKQYDPAIREFQATLALNPNVPLAHSGLGVCLLQKGDINNAEANFRKALELSPDLADAKIGMATIHYKRKNYAGAVQLFEQVYQYRQESIPIAAMMADSYIRLKQFDQAIPHLQRGIQLDPKTASWYFRLMESNYLAGHYAESLKVYDQYSSLFLTSSKYRMRVANMLLGMQRVSEAANILRGLKSDPEYSAAAQKQLTDLGMGST